MPHRTQNAPTVVAHCGLPETEFSQITAPGAYLMESTGILVRVTPDAVGAGRSSLIAVTGHMPVRFARLSDDCWIPISKARQLAADADLNVAF